MQMIQGAQGASKPSQKWSARAPILLGSITVFALVFGFGAWSAFASISGAVVASARLKVETEQQVVQHPDGGVVTEILVQEGDVVEAGDVMVRLDDKLLLNELAIVESQLFELLARTGRLKAERDGLAAPEYPDELLDMRDQRDDVAELIEGQTSLFEARNTTQRREAEQLRERQSQIRDEIRGSESQMESLASQLSFIGEELGNQRSLLDRGLAQAAAVFSLERENARLHGQSGELTANIARLKGQITEIEIQLVSLEAGRREEAITELRDLEFRITELRERRAQTLETLDRLDVRAPRPGVVLDMQIHALRSVIRPADAILFIVPSDTDLVVEARLETINIDQVFPTQEARLVFSAFNQRTTPNLLGHIIRVSPDALIDEATGASYYTALIGIDDGELEKLEGLTLVAGMPVEAFITTGDRSPLSYFTKPFTDYFNKALRED